jgi:hypothetical protein
MQSNTSSRSVALRLIQLLSTFFCNLFLSRSEKNFKRLKDFIC